MKMMPTLNSSGRVFPVAADIPKSETSIFEDERTVLTVLLVTVFSRFSANSSWSLPPSRSQSAETEVKLSSSAHHFLNGTDFNSKDELFTSVILMRVCCFSRYIR